AGLSKYGKIIPPSFHRPAYAQERCRPDRRMQLGPSARIFFPQMYDTAFDNFAGLRSEANGRPQLNFGFAFPSHFRRNTHFICGVGTSFISLSSTLPQLHGEQILRSAHLKFSSIAPVLLSTWVPFERLTALISCRYSSTDMSSARQTSMDLTRYVHDAPLV